MPIPISARFTNDSEKEVTVLWHRPMEAGLVVAQEIARIAPGRSRILRSFANHSFSIFEDEDELRHWTMGTQRRQNYRVSFDKMVPAPTPRLPVGAAPRPKPRPTASSGSPESKGKKEEMTDQQLESRLAQARSLAFRGQHAAALETYREVSAGLDLTARPKLAARIAFLEKLAVARQPAGVTRAKTERCATCTLPKPCGRDCGKGQGRATPRYLGGSKRTYAEVAAAGTKRKLPPPPPLGRGGAAGSGAQRMTGAATLGEALRRRRASLGHLVRAVPPTSPRLIAFTPCLSHSPVRTSTGRALASLITPHTTRQGQSSSDDEDSGSDADEPSSSSSEPAKRQRITDEKLQQIIGSARRLNAEARAAADRARKLASGGSVERALARAREMMAVHHSRSRSGSRSDAEFVARLGASHAAHDTYARWGVRRGGGLRPGLAVKVPTASDTAPREPTPRYRAVTARTHLTAPPAAPELCGY
jgi:hypothetical protein